MLRHTMIETIGAEYLTSNIEAGEYSYVQAAGNRTLLESKVGHPITHFKLDLRFESEDIVILIETKSSQSNEKDHLHSGQYHQR